MGMSGRSHLPAFRLPRGPFPRSALLRKASYPFSLMNPTPHVLLVLRSVLPPELPQDRARVFGAVGAGLKPPVPEAADLDPAFCLAQVPPALTVPQLASGACALARVSGSLPDDAGLAVCTAASDLPYGHDAATSQSPIEARALLLLGRKGVLMVPRWRSPHRMRRTEDVT